MANATDDPCQRSGLLDAPAEKLHVDVVDLPRMSSQEETAALGLPRDSNTDMLRDGAPVVTPDLSSRARSLAILREIFGEPVSAEDEMDVGLAAPAVSPGEQTPDAAPFRRPAAGMPNGEPPAPGTSADDESDTLPRDVQLPGADESETLRYRNQMYRTDI